MINSLFHGGVAMKKNIKIRGVRGELASQAFQIVNPMGAVWSLK